MPVTNKTSNLIHDPMTPGSVPADPQKARGRLIVATGTVENAADDLSGSKFHLASIPSTALLHEDTAFDVENWGFAQIVIGTESDTDALIDQTKATENIVTPVAFGDASHGLMIWEVLGLASDPGGNVELWAHAEADATGAGALPFRVAYLAP